MPFWSVGVESCLKGGERLRWQALVGLAVGFVGIVVLVWPEISIGGRAGRDMFAGVLALQVACLGWALGTSYTKRHVAGGDPMAGAMVQMLFSGVMLLGRIPVLPENAVASSMMAPALFAWWLCPVSRTTVRSLPCSPKSTSPI